MKRKMGRKGVGKLAALSVSENVLIKTISNGEKSGFVLSSPYKTTIIYLCRSLTGKFLSKEYLATVLLSLCRIRSTNFIVH